MLLNFQTLQSRPKVLLSLGSAISELVSHRIISQTPPLSENVGVPGDAEQKFKGEILQPALQ